MLRPIIALLAVINIALSGTSFADDAKWAQHASFGLGITKENTTYPVVTFIPTTFLLFNVDKSSKLIEDKKYKRVTTQDGVELYMLLENISSGNIFEKLGKTLVIFNSKKRICRTETGCNRKNVDEVLEIHSGHVFKKSEEGGKIELSGQRHGEKITGVVSKSDLKKWNKQGIVTFADRSRLPRLKITREDGNYFNLKCNKDRKKGDQAVAEMNEADKIINKKLRLASINKENNVTNVIFNRDYGGENRSFKFYTYTVAKKDNQGTYNVEKVYIAQVTYECFTDGTMSERNRILSVILALKGNSEKKITLKPWGTPHNLSQEATNTPHYLYSVNNETQYFDLMSKLSKLFRNRAESGYFLAEFNRSCNSSYRSQEKCNSHQYKN